VVVATGATSKWLGVPGEREFFGRGVSNCATCDGSLFKGKDVMVVGGGDSAVEEALHLNRLGCNVKLVHRGDKLRASKYMQDKLFAANPHINIMWNSEVQEVHGDKTVKGVTVRNNRTGEELGVPASGLFVAIAHTPNTTIFKGELKLDDKGYIVTDPGTAQTSVPGVFAAGEAADPDYRQIATSVGDGVKAGMGIGRQQARQVNQLQSNTNQLPFQLLAGGALVGLAALAINSISSNKKAA